MARSDYRAGWAIVVIALVFLLCPGCGEGEGDAAAFMVVGVVAGVAGVAQAVRATLRAREADRLLESRTTLMDVALRDLSKANAKVRGLEIDKADARHVADEYAAEAKALRSANAGLSADLAHMRSKVPADQAALDACAALLSGPNAPGEHTAARVALRATGRLGGALAEEPKT